MAVVMSTVTLTSVPASDARKVGEVQEFFFFFSTLEEYNRLLIVTCIQPFVQIIFMHCIAFFFFFFFFLVCTFSFLLFFPGVKIRTNSSFAATTVVHSVSGSY